MGSLPASSSPSTALCGPSPGTWPRLGVGGAARGELASFIFTIDSTLWASARHLASAGCRGAARGELAGFIFTIDCTLRASARHLASGVGGRCAGSSPAPSVPLAALCGPQPSIRPGRPLWLGRRIPPSPLRSPTAVLPLLPTPFFYYLTPHSLSPLTHPSLHPLPPSLGPLLTLHTLTPPGPSCGGDQALLDRGIHQRYLIP